MLHSSSVIVPAYVVATLLLVFLLQMSNRYTANAEWTQTLVCRSRLCAVALEKRCEPTATLLSITSGAASSPMFANAIITTQITVVVTFLSTFWYTRQMGYTWSPISQPWTQQHRGHSVSVSIRRRVSEDRQHQQQDTKLLTRHFRFCKKHYNN